MKFTAKDVAQLMIDNYNGKVVVPANFSEGEVKTADEAISDAFFQVLGITDKENCTAKDVVLAFRNESARNGVFAIIEEVIREGIINEGWRNAFFDRFVESRSQARGDKTVFYVEARNELVVSRISKDGRVSLDRQRFDEGAELSIRVETYGIKVYEHIARILLGRADWSKLVARLNEAVEQFIAEKTYDTFATVCNNLPTQFRHAGAYSRKAIKKLISNVKRAAGASSVTLFGTDVALEYLEDGMLADYPTDELKNELHRTGRLGTWYGETLVELPNSFRQGSALTKNVMQDDVIFVIPNNVIKPVKMVVEPELMDINESGVRVDDTIEFAVRFSFGCNVITGCMLGVISAAGISVVPDGKATPTRA